MLLFTALRCTAFIESKYVVLHLTPLDPEHLHELLTVQYIMLQNTRCFGLVTLSRHQIAHLTSSVAPASQRTQLPPDHSM